VLELVEVQLQGTSMHKTVSKKLSLREHAPTQI